jgi:hypothetical protein
MRMAKGKYGMGAIPSFHDGQVGNGMCMMSEALAHSSQLRKGYVAGDRAAQCTISRDKL